MEMAPCRRIGVELSMYHRQGKTNNNKNKQTNTNGKQKVSRFIIWILHK